MSAQEEAVIEAVARAICRAHCGPVMRAKEPERVECQVENGWDMWVDEARAAILAYQKATAGARDEVIDACVRICRDMAAERHGVYAKTESESVENRAYAAYDAYLNAATAIAALKSPPTGEK